MKIEGDYMVFSTGKEAYAYAGVIGLDPVLHVFGGYDDSVYEYNNDLSKAERIELADYMIEQWQKFRALAEGKGDA